MHLGSTSGNATITSTAPAIFTATSTKPTSALASGRIVVPGSTNYMKFLPVFASSPGGSPTCRVVLWNFNVDLNQWVPFNLAQISYSAVAGTKTATVFGVDLFSGTNGTVAGDAKHVQISTTHANTFCLVDTMGCDLVEFVFSSTTPTGNPAANVLWGEM